ncbi:MAG TPA: small-conductance mechanosensitive channel [Bacillota bacterium]|nr:small-conductance mechanosensitive channel [Bacillota bacterium]
MSEKTEAVQMENVTSNSGSLSISKFHAKSHFWGRLTLWSVIILTLTLPMYLSFGLGHHPGWNVILTGFVAYAAIVAVVWVVEPISYYPVLGVSGTYLAFLNGNIGNMVLPSAAVAQEVIGAQPGTEKGEVTATLAITGAAIVNTTILVFVVLGGSVLLTVLPDNVLVAFDYVLPAIYGGVIAQFAIQKPSWGVAGIVIGLAVNLGPIPQAFETFLCVFGTIAACLMLDKMNKDKKEVA